MKKLPYIFSAILLIILAGCAATPPEVPAPDGLTHSGTWVVRESEVLRIATGNSGRGTLIFQGWEYPFEFTGAKFRVTGTETGDIVGEVYNLETISDFEGPYNPTTELDAASKVTGFWASNDKGVTLHMKVQGADISAHMNAVGATVKLLKQ